MLVYWKCMQIFIRHFSLAFLRHFSDYYVMVMINSQTDTHTHASVAGRNDKILFLIFCCVLYCIAHGNRRHYGSWKQRPQTEKKADEHGKRPTPKSLRTFAGRTIERTHSNLAANTHTYTADETRENVFFILIFKKGTPFVIYVQAHNSSAVITWMAQKKKRRRACMQKENFNERFSS